MSSNNSGTKAWKAYALAAPVLLAVICLFRLDSFELAWLPYLRLWGVRFIALALFSLLLGLAWRNAWLKTLAFSGAAVLAALGSGEAFLAYQEAKISAPQSELAAVPPEFVEEIRRSRDLRAEDGSKDNDTGIREARFRGDLVRDADEARKILSEAGVTVDRPDAITAPEAGQPDPKLGYRPVRRAAEIMAVKRAGTNIIYSVVYNLNADGWRLTPQHPQAEEAVVFMGCSMTFGEGLNDRDTFPAKVSELLGERFQVYNFSYSGYGTHHLVAMIEEGYLDEIAKKYQKMHVFYLTIPAHALRNAGKSSWDQDGPSYQFNASGQLEYQGSFRQARQRGQSKNYLLSKLGEDSYIKNLHLALIQKADQLLREKYGSSLNVIEVFTMEDYLDVLPSKKIPLLKIIPNPAPEHTIRGDGHPSALATAVFAREIVKFLQDSRQ